MVSASGLAEAGPLVLLIWGLSPGGMDAFPARPRPARPQRPDSLGPDGDRGAARLFIKPLAFSRYFVVVLPAVVPVLALQFSRPHQPCWSNRPVPLALPCCSAGGGLVGRTGSGGGCVSRTVCRSPAHQRPGGAAVQPRARLLNPVTDEVAMGELGESCALGDGDDLEQRPTASFPPDLWLASSGPRSC